MPTFFSFNGNSHLQKSSARMCAEDNATTLFVIVLRITVRPPACVASTATKCCWKSQSLTAFSGEEAAAKSEFSKLTPSNVDVPSFHKSESGSMQTHVDSDLLLKKESGQPNLMFSSPSKPLLSVTDREIFAALAFGMNPTMSFNFAANAYFKKGMDSR